MYYLPNIFGKGEPSQKLLISSDEITFKAPTTKIWLQHDASNIYLLRLSLC